MNFKSTRSGNLVVDMDFKTFYASILNIRVSFFQYYEVKIQISPKKLTSKIIPPLKGKTTMKKMKNLT